MNREESKPLDERFVKRLAARDEALNHASQGEGDGRADSTADDGRLGDAVNVLQLLRQAWLHESQPSSLGELSGELSAELRRQMDRRAGRAQLPTVEQFVQRLDDSQILAAESLSEIWDTRIDQDVRQLAERLVASGSLTPYQAVKLFNDEADDLRLGRYLVLGELGRGGMGAVYRAYDTLYRREVAIKTLHVAGAEAILRLKHEFRVTSDLAHRNLVVLYELHVDADRWFFTMELLQGQSFLGYVCSGNPAGTAGDPTKKFVSGLTLAEAGNSAGTPETLPVRGQQQFARLRTMLAELATGLQVLHAAGVVHRDVKPTNVIVTEAGRLVLLDFGLATGSRWSLHDANSKAVVGTLPYMAPELLQGRPPTSASDFYSCGTMLFMALTGHSPFRGSAEEIRATKTSDAGIPHDCFPAQVPQDLAVLCRRLMSTDPAARPGADEILAVCQSEEKPQHVTAPSGQQSPVDCDLIGREVELARLHQTKDAAWGGVMQVLFVGAVSGVGKTALAETFLRQIKTDGQTVILRGRCFHRESVPYKALDGIVDDLCRHLMDIGPGLRAKILPRNSDLLAGLFPLLRRIPEIAAGANVTRLRQLDADQRQRAFAAFADLFDRLSQLQPVVLFVDDLQWGDADSAALFQVICSRLAQSRVLLFGCYRSDEAESSPFLRRMIASELHGDAARSRVEVSLDALSPADAFRLASERLSEPADHELAERLALESGGNPFYLLELIRYWEAGGDTTGGDEPGGEPSVGAVVRHTVRRLPAQGRAVMEVISLAGQPLPRDVLDGAVPEPVDESIVAALQTNRLLRSVETDEGVRFESYHDRVRESIVATLAADQQRRYHRLLADGFIRLPSAPPVTIAFHLRGAGESRQAAEYTLQAARDALARFAFDQAATHYTEAISLDESLETSGAIREELARSLASAGRRNNAGREYLKASELVRAEDQQEMCANAAEQFFSGGRLSAGLNTARDVFQQLGYRLPKSDREAICRFVIAQCRLLVAQRDIPTASRTEVTEETVQRLLAVWRMALPLGHIDMLTWACIVSEFSIESYRTGHPEVVSHALFNESAFYVLKGERGRKRTWQFIDRVEGILQRCDDPLLRVYQCRLVAGAHHFVGEWKDAIRAMTAGEAHAEEHQLGELPVLSTGKFVLFSAMYQAGQLKELQEQVFRRRSEARLCDDFFLETNASTGPAGLAWLMKDDPQGAAAAARAVMRRWPRDRFLVQHWFALFGDVDALLYQGKGQAACERLTQAWKPLASAGFLRYQFSRAISYLMRIRCAVAAAREVGSHRIYTPTVKRDARRLAKEQASWILPMAKLGRAAQAEIAGGRQETLLFLEEAEQGYRASESGLHEQAVRRRRGMLLGGTSGQELVVASDTWFRDQGVVNPERLVAMLIP